MMLKMLVPVAVLAAGLSIAPVRANAQPLPDRTALARAATTSAKPATVARQATVAKAVTTAQAARPSVMSAAKAPAAARTVAKAPVAKGPAKAATKAPVKTAAKAGSGDITGSIRRNESCTVAMVDLFDRKGNYAKTEKMRVCQ